MDVKDRYCIRLCFMWALSLLWAYSSVVIANEDIYANARNEHWAYRPIVKPAVPSLDDPPASLSDIDHFILARLRQAGLEFCPPADKRTLIRRATFDLTGLPPTFAEVQAFLADESPGAFATVVDRLLESDRYGERWGRHWLDLARYADTHGGAPLGIVLFPFSYTYRDYVIDAINRDVPYDRFVLEQIAADQLDLGGQTEALAALGFLTVGRQYRNHHDTIDDRIDVVTRGLMGLNVACARCHDHKYDAIPIEDYYSLYAVFAGSEPPEDLPYLQVPEDSDEFREFQRRLQHLKANRDNALRDHLSITQNRWRMQVGIYLRELALGTPEQDLSAKFLSFRTEDLRPNLLERWREYLEETVPSEDPVFGVWQRCLNLADKDFEQGSAAILAGMRAENGEDGADPQKYHAHTATAPRWNPRVLDAMETQPLKSMLDVATAYGDLFATVQKEWLQGMLDASLEATVGMEAVADFAPQHQFFFSAVDRQLRQHLYGTGTPTTFTYPSVEIEFNRSYRSRITRFRTDIHNFLLKSAASPPRAMVLYEQETPRPQHVFVRGNPIDRGEVVQARFLALLSHGERKPFTDGKRRLELAQAVVHPDNPLTSRVFVNWVWQHHFGHGLVRTPGDFGKRGESPTHPDLLDYLATQFVEDGWSLKHLHKIMMLTATYQQASVRPYTDDSSNQLEASQIDPENRLLWRMAPQRLELEAMRDSMLAVSGVLDVSMGGRPIDLFATPTVPRRTVYGFINRDVIPPLFGTFDMADPSSCTAERPNTNVPQQALFALNSEFVMEQATFLADATVEHKPDSATRVRQLYQRAYARNPDDDELSLALRYIENQPPDAEPSAWVRFAQVLLASNEFIFVD